MKSTGSPPGPVGYGGWNGMLCALAISPWEALKSLLLLQASHRYSGGPQKNHFPTADGWNITLYSVMTFATLH